ncbi:hypothetical protein IW262DRAFT_1296909 [Armillaria fumosa]|nr:hypothetical protein IW262DRAFT_1296909 [Armillaria fumosa]
MYTSYSALRYSADTANQSVRTGFSGARTGVFGLSAKRAYQLRLLSIRNTGHPSGSAQGHNRPRLSYGKLTPDEIAAMLQLHRQAAPKSALPQPPYMQSGNYAMSDDDSAVGSDADDELIFAIFVLCQSLCILLSTTSWMNTMEVVSTLFSALLAVSPCALHLCSSDTTSSSDGEEGASPSSSPTVPVEPVVPVVSSQNGAGHVLRSSARAKVRTEKGDYIKTLVDNGLLSQLGCDDNIRDDPSVDTPPVSRCKASGITAKVSDKPTPPSAEVYLEDLGSLPPSVLSGHHAPTPLAVVADAGLAVKSPSLLSSIVKTLVMQKPIDNAVDAGPSSVSVIDLTGVDNILPSSDAVHPGDAEGLLSTTQNMGADNFFSGLDAFISDRCCDHESEPEDIADAAGDSRTVPLSLSKPPLPPLREPDDVTLHVMQPELQEGQLVPLYAQMPSIGSVYFFDDPAMFEHPACITYDEIVPFFSHDALRSFLSYMHFTGHAPYCNLATMPHSAFASDGKKVLYASHTAVAMTCTSMTSNGPEFTTCAFVSHEDGLSNKNKVPSLAQRKEPASAYRSPTKLSSARKDYWHCLGFSDDVLIFDGHASKNHHFFFHPQDFDNLSSLPRYTPSHDLDYFMLVAVGYTPTIWCVKKRPHLNLNIQFVVVLGQAPNAEELAAAGYVG